MKKIEHPKLIISSKMVGEDYVLISFEDNGSGIPIEIKDKIWDPFLQPKTKAKEQGLDLELSKELSKNTKEGLKWNLLQEKQGLWFIYR